MDTIELVVECVVLVEFRLIYDVSAPPHKENQEKREERYCWVCFRRGKPCLDLTKLDKSDRKRP
jgi:hypothetical protein